MLLLLLLGLAKGGARITLNKAATDKFGAAATRLLLRAHSGKLEVKLCGTGDDKGSPHMALPLIARQRGGAEATINASSAAPEHLSAILGVLPQRQQRPYALLTVSSGGWLLAEPYDVDGDPPRSDPHLRMWWSQTTPTASAPTDDEYVARVRLAASVVRESSRRVGKPRKEVVAARAVMKAFEELAWQVIPDLMCRSLHLI